MRENDFPSVYDMKLRRSIKFRACMHVFVSSNNRPQGFRSLNEYTAAGKSLKANT